MLLTASNQAVAADMEEIIEMYQRDTDRTSPLKMLERYKSIVKEVSGMGVRDDIEIVSKSRDAAREEFYKSFLKQISSSEDGVNDLAGHEFLLKRLKLLDKKTELKQFIYETVYAGVTGLYDFDKKVLVLMKGANQQSLSRTLLHELIHAAQDSVVDLKSLYGAKKGSSDAGDALSSLVEGQAVAIGTLIQVSKNIGDSTVEKIMHDLIEEYETRLADYEYTDFFSESSQFPYTYGFLFVAKRYKDSETKDFKSMFNSIPLSTEQILHHDKFVKNEQPLKTRLEKLHKPISKSWKMMFSTTLGEYFIQTMFNVSLSNEKKLNKAAAYGWGGDRLDVYEHKGKRFLIWDTLWDTKSDAAEFYKRYQSFSKWRFNVKNFSKTKLFDSVYPKNNSNFFVKLSKNRVLIIEGDVEKDVERLIARALNLRSG